LVPFTASLLFAIAVGLGQANGVSEAKDESVDKVQLERWQKYYREVAAQYQMSGGSGRTFPLQLHPQPIVTYFNPVGGGQTLGAIFVWTNARRPEIAGAIWSKREDQTRRMIHSFHSLSLEPVQAERNGSVFWSPAHPGIQTMQIPDGPAPAATATARFTQMRSIARDIAASTVRGSAERELRLLTQPVLRFDDNSVERDGSLFMWFEDWDPELMAVIETKSTSQGPRWHVGFARFTNLPVSARYRGENLWSFAASAAEPSQGGPEHRYISVHSIEILPANREE
jgi:hypothetical protein